MGKRKSKEFVAYVATIAYKQGNDAAIRFLMEQRYKDPREKLRLLKNGSSTFRKTYARLKNMDLIRAKPWIIQKCLTERQLVSICDALCEEWNLPKMNRVPFHENCQTIIRYNATPVIMTGVDIMITADKEFISYEQRFGAKEIRFAYITKTFCHSTMCNMRKGCMNDGRFMEILQKKLDAMTRNNMEFLVEKRFQPYCSRMYVRKEATLTDKQEDKEKGVNF